MKLTSKYRNVYGAPQKDKFTDLRMAEITSEGSLLAINQSFLAVSWQGVGGCVGIFNPNTPSRIATEIPVLRGHSSYVSELKFNPFRPNMLATGSDDTTVKLWELPEGGITEDMENDVQTFKGHQRKIVNVAFNPVVDGVIASTSFDKTCQIWNIAKAEAICKVDFKDVPTSLDWNYNGSLVGASTKEKLIYLIDPRTNAVAVKAKGHESHKIQKMLFIEDNYFISCGFNKNSQREVKLYDIRNQTDAMIESSIASIVVDRQSGVMTPFYDSGLKLLYVPGRGEGNIHYYDLNDLTLKECSEYKSSQPQKQIAMFEKKLMDYNKCEIARFAKVVANTVEYLSFYVPRRNPGYEREFYPNIAAGEAALTYDDWIAGQNAEPIVKEITEIENKWVSAVPIVFEKKQEEVKKSSEEIIKEMEAKMLGLEQKVNNLTAANEKLNKEIATMKEKCAALEKENEELKSRPKEETAPVEEPVQEQEQVQEPPQEETVQEPVQEEQVQEPPQEEAVQEQEPPQEEVAQEPPQEEEQVQEPPQEE